MLDRRRPLMVLVCLLLVGQAASATSTSARAPVSEREARAFNERVVRMNERGDRRLLSAYRDDTQLLFLLEAADEPSGMRLTGPALRKFLSELLGARDEYKSGTSCRYSARPDGQMLESCVSVNILRAAPLYSEALIARDERGLHYATVLVTDSLARARAVRLQGTQTEVGGRR